MELPSRVQDIINALYVAHRDLATGTDDDRRALTRMMAQQACFELGAAWGVKASSPTNPQGQSQIAFNGGPQLVGWRWQDNDGSVTGVVNGPVPNPPMQSFAGQFFIAVDAVDHLHADVPQPSAPPAAGAGGAASPGTAGTAASPSADDEIEKLVSNSEHLIDVMEALDQSVNGLSQRIDNLVKNGLRIKL